MSFVDQITDQVKPVIIATVNSSVNAAIINGTQYLKRVLQDSVDDTQQSVTDQINAIAVDFRRSQGIVLITIVVCCFFNVLVVLYLFRKYRIRDEPRKQRPLVGPPQTDDHSQFVTV